MDMEENQHFFYADVTKIQKTPVIQALTRMRTVAEILCLSFEVHVPSVCVWGGGMLFLLITSNKDFSVTVFEVLGPTVLDTHHPNSLANKLTILQRRRREACFSF